MRVLLGMFLGVLITVGAAFVYDSSTGRVANGLTLASTEGHAPMVNWDVVSHDWDGMKQQLRDVAVDIEKGWKRITSLVFHALVLKYIKLKEPSSPRWMRGQTRFLLKRRLATVSSPYQRRCRLLLVDFPGQMESARNLD
jgi:hypothetical protein